MERISKNTKDTEKIAIDFLVKLKPAKNHAVVVGLYGDLGSGKTTFTQTVGKYFGIKKKINSPTFVIIKRYNLKKRGFYKNFLADKKGPVSAGENFYKNHVFESLFHIDAYRLKNEKELIDLGWEEMISNSKNLILIEWPEQVINAMPKKHHEVHIFHIKEGHRKFKIKKI